MGNEQDCSEHMYYGCTRENLIVCYYSLYDINDYALKVCYILGVSILLNHCMIRDCKNFSFIVITITFYNQCTLTVRYTALRTFYLGAHFPCCYSRTRSACNERESFKIWVAGDLNVKINQMLFTLMSQLIFNNTFH